MAATDGESAKRGRVPAPLKRRLPNALTIARVVMTVAFVAVLSVYRFPQTNAWALPTGLALFVVAAATDFLDGYLARRWNVVSIFGRIVDPLADKALVLGAFVLLAGSAFWFEASEDQVSGVAPWMVVVILSRELLVTTMRAVLEARGIDFSAAASGKVKMIAQSVGVPAIFALVLLASRNVDPAQDAETGPSLIATACFNWNEAIAWGLTILTAWSAWPYIKRGASLSRPPKEDSRG